MRNLFTLLILFSVPLFSQTFLNVHDNDGTNQNVVLTSLNKITFSPDGGEINYYIPDIGLVTRTVSAVQKLTFDESGLGEILPVELVSFTSIINQNKVTLLWVTATELNNYGFDIERFQSLSGWNKIGFIKGRGSSNSSTSYSFIDKPLDGSKFQYRLKQIDKDGKFTYSNVIDVVLGVPSNFELKQNFPNPFNPSTKITYNVPLDGIITLIVYDIMGRKVFTLVNENKKAGSYEVTLDGSPLASGTYFCKMTAKNFTSSIKMLFIK